MSSTNRGADRDPLDDYPSPRWTVHRLLEACELPGGFWYEPCAGAGNIVRAVDDKRLDVLWYVNELNPAYLDSLHELETVRQVRSQDARELVYPKEVSVIITNPPFSLAEDILIRALLSKAIPVFLQRLGWGGGPRAEAFREFKPSVYQLPQRPSFKDVITVDPKTGKLKKSSQDSTEYAWFVFDGKGTYTMLGDTPEEVRAAEKAKRRAALKVVSGLVWAAGPQRGNLVEMCPDGAINNCAKVNVGDAAACQMCGGGCFEETRPA